MFNNFFRLDLILFSVNFAKDKIEIIEIIPGVAIDFTEIARQLIKTTMID